MKEEGCCVVKFTSDGIIKIVPFALVFLNGAKFQPRSALDIPDDPVRVKWQRSVCLGDFSDDGCFEARVLIIAGSLKAAMAKAKEQNLKLPPCPYISLPASTSSLPTPSTSSSPAESKLRNRNSSDHKDHSKGKRSTSQKTKASGAQNNNSGDHSNNKDIDNHSQRSVLKGKRSSPGKKKDTSSVKNCTVHEESSSEQSVNNSEGTERDRRKRKINKAAKDPVVANRLKEIMNSAVLSNPLMQDKDASGLRAAEESSNLEKTDRSIVEFDSPIKKSKREGSCDNKQDDKSSPLIDHVKKDLLQNFLTPVKNTLCSSTPVKENSSNNIQNVTSIEKTLPAEIQPMDEVESDSESSDSSHSSSNDATFNLAEENLQLKCTVAKLKENLAEAKRQSVLANNLRVTYKQKNEELEKEVLLLRKRNGTLQDLLTKAVEVKPHTKSSGPSGTVEPHTKSRFTVEPQTESSLVQSPQHGFNSVDDNLNLSDTMLSSSADKLDSSSSPAAKKKKEKKLKLTLDNAALNTSCDLVLSHLRKDKPLVADKNGMINIGNDTTVNKEAFEKNFIENKLDIKKACKQMTSLTWSHKDRIVRSLTGSKNNKCPDAPSKVAATPTKVLAILGAMKAHMKFIGDKEGPSMLSCLNVCHKAIGEKLATDAQKSKK